MAPRKLTEEELARPYSKYYFNPVAEPDCEAYRTVLAGPMSPGNALSPAQVNLMLAPGYLAAETGWCAMPDGSAYVSVLTRMPGVTIEMVKWWFAWHPLESLRYMLWYPACHFSARVGPSDQAALCDPSVPLEEKIYGRRHIISEDFSGRNVDSSPEFHIHFRRPEEIGFDAAQLAAQPGVFVICSFPDENDILPEGSPPTVMMHFVRETEQGCELRSRFWLGYSMRDRTPVLMLPPGGRIPEEAPYMLARHCVEEYSNLRSFLPALYREQAGQPWLSPSDPTAPGKHMS